MGETNTVKGYYERKPCVDRFQWSHLAYHTGILWVAMTISTLIVAWFLILFVPNQDYPVLRGPYLALIDCQDVQQWYEKNGYLTGGCSMMPVPQETMIPRPDDEGAPYMEVKPRKEKL